MFSTSYPSWGCRCCTNPAGSQTHSLWSLYSASGCAAAPPPPNAAPTNTYSNSGACDNWAANGECVPGHQWYNWMMTYCAGSCHAVSTGASPPPPPPPSYTDTYSSCAGWASNGECQPGNYWRNWMMQYCPASCAALGYPPPNASRRRATVDELSAQLEALRRVKATGAKSPRVHPDDVKKR